MDKTYNKIIAVSFVITAFFFGWVVSVLMRVLSGMWGPFAKLTGDPTVQHGVPVLFALAFFVFLIASKSTKAWASDVALEISKVVWPSVKDTKALTIVVCFIILISAAIFAVFDFVSNKLVEFILGMQF
ncbi:MAG: preprotein translocase subunit SecE [Bdellovibrionaceae bacterium]|nr:preprotein translocase subunit SecE [Pseudobdellovibrionaceae bacterium]